MSPLPDVILTSTQIQDRKKLMKVMENLTHLSQRQTEMGVWFILFVFNNKQTTFQQQTNILAIYWTSSFLSICFPFITCLCSVFSQAS